MNKNGIIIFGASAGALKDIKIFRNIGTPILYLVDNDSGKWGTHLEHIEIIPPQKLYDIKVPIVIASNYQAEIESQLMQMGLAERIILKEDLLVAYLKKNREIFSFTSNVSSSVEKTIVFDIPEGYALGGIENWTFCVATGLHKAGYKVAIIAQKTSLPVPTILEECMIYQDMDYDNYLSYITNLTKILLRLLPCCVIDSWQRHVMIASSILKQTYPEMIRTISIVHNDYIRYYQRIAFWNQYEDAVAGVSRKILRVLEEKYNISSDKLYYKESPVNFDKTFMKKYRLDKNEPLRIGFAARITKLQKRAHLLPDIARLLIDKGVHFRLHIAGDGDYFKKLQERIKSEELDDYIILYGRIQPTNMDSFWKDKDIFISLSDFEGVGLSMLEAMSYGAVPVEMDVAGADEFITKDNGFLCGSNELDEMADSILYLDRNRQELQKMGEMSRRIIEEKCNHQQYIEFIKVLCGV